MTLDEAIKHCNEVACKHDKCATEHKQLAQWLTELKSYRVSATQETQKATDKVELKVEAGDWVVSNNNGEVWQIGAKSTEEGQPVYLCNVNDAMISITLDVLNNDYHLWTLADAKSGDVLAFNDDIVIFKDLYNSSTFHSYCYIKDGVFDISENDMPDWWEGKGFQPATKEQSDTLIKAMANAGWEFDFEKKELKKIEHKMLDPDKVIEWFRVNWWDSHIGDPIDKFKKDFGL